MMKKCRCGLCGCEYKKTEKFKNEYLILEAISKYNTLEYIDSLLEICPHCGLVRIDISNNIKQQNKDKFHKMITANEYQKILTNEISIIEKKILLHELLIKNKVDIVEIYPDTNYIKWLYYDFLHEIDKAELYRNKAKEYLINEINVDIGDVPPTTTKEHIKLSVNMQYNLYLADIYRKNNEFNKALHILTKYNVFKFDETEFLEKQWFKKLKKLCKNRDAISI